MRIIYIRLLNGPSRHHRLITCRAHPRFRNLRPSSRRSWCGIARNAWKKADNFRVATTAMIHHRDAVALSSRKTQRWLTRNYCDSIRRLFPKILDSCVMINFPRNNTLHSRNAFISSHSRKRMTSRYFWKRGEKLLNKTFKDKDSSFSHEGKVISSTESLIWRCFIGLRLRKTLKLRCEK